MRSKPAHGCKQGHPGSLWRASRGGSGPGANFDRLCLLKCFFHSIPSNEETVKTTVEVLHVVNVNGLQDAHLYVQVMCYRQLPVGVGALRRVGRRPFALLSLREKHIWWVVIWQSEWGWLEKVPTWDISSALSSPLSKMMSLRESLSEGLDGKQTFELFQDASLSLGGEKNLQKWSSEYIFIIIFVIIIFITWLVSSALGAGGFLNGSGPFHGAGQSRRRRYVLHVVQQTQFIHALRGRRALRMLVGGVLRLWAVGVAQDACGGQLVALNPRVVIADNVLVVQARQKRDLAFDPPELLTGWIDLDALHGVITAI